MPRSPQGKFISFKTCIFISSSQSERYLNDSAFLLEYLHGLVWNCGFKKKKKGRKTEKGKENSFLQWICFLIFWTVKNDSLINTWLVQWPFSVGLEIILGADGKLMSKFKNSWPQGIH